jgi:cyclopropane fatty-acyl-phospholipid synthase-like methyltransferase
MKEDFDCSVWWEERWERKPNFSGCSEKTYDALKTAISRGIKELRIKTEGKTLLDIGCGRGEMLRWLKEMGMEVYGTDIGKAPIDYLKEEGFFVYKQDIRYLEGNRHDIVSCFFVAQNMISDNDLCDLYQSIDRSLKTRGLLILADEFKNGSFNVNVQLRDMEEHRHWWKVAGYKKVREFEIEEENKCKKLLFLRKGNISFLV